MAANGVARKGRRHPEGYWGKWKGVAYSAAACEKPARCKGMCPSHYNKHRWSTGVRSPSVNPVSRRKAHLRHRYGISLSEYERLFDEQGGVCAVCKQPPTEKNTCTHWDNKLCVDHCHSRKKVRGLLCNDCNLAIGYGKTAEILLPPPIMYEITRDTVAEIVEGGVEDVFDIEVERTANFIANGLVSHNTRWHEDDLAGRALNHEEWRVISLPALAEPDDPLGRSRGAALVR